MRKLMFLLLAVLTLTACTQEKEEKQEVVYMQITAAQAKELMDAQEGYVIVDTRTQEEYSEGHIPGAVLLPHDEVEKKAETVLPDKNQLILVYCRSGRRSKIAAQALADLGYTNVKEFGGIIDWPYEIDYAQ